MFCVERKQTFENKFHCGPLKTIYTYLQTNSPKLITVESNLPPKLITNTRITEILLTTIGLLENIEPHFGVFEAQVNPSKAEMV